MTPACAKRGSNSRERGVFIPLLAVMALVILFILITFGLDSSSVRRASRNLEQFAEQTCREVAAKAVLQKQAAESFQKQINAAVSGNLVKDVTITEAVLLIPTMPRDGDFGFAGEQPVPTPYVVSPPGLINGLPAGRNFADILGSSNACQINCINSVCTDCRFLGSSRDGSAVFPDSMWDDYRNAGNTAACIISGTIQTVMSGSAELHARTVWKGSIHAPQDFPPVTPTVVSADIPNLAGLVMVIAPEMQTRSDDVRFRFSSLVHGQVYDTSVRQKYDPLYSYSVTGGSPGSNGFAQAGATIAGIPYMLPVPSPIPTDTPTPNLTPQPTGTATSTPTRTFTPSPTPLHFVATKTPTPAPTATPTLTPTIGIEPPDLISGKCRHSASGNNLNCATPLETDRNVPGGSQYADLGDCAAVPSATPGVNCLETSDREEMLASCSNPAVLIRNSLTSMILELAMRHGELRNMTEVLIANPTNLNPANYLNNPVEVIPFGADLAEPKFEIPYVFYNSGDQAGGVINTLSAAYHQFPSNIPADKQVRSYHRLEAGQLRWCYHMFYGTNNSGGRNRYDMSVPDLVNDRFEPNNPGEIYSFDPSLRQQSFPVWPKDTWDQECPWGTTGTSCTYARTRGLNGPELVSAVGSVQLCPYEKYKVPTPSPSGADICQKPADAVNGDLRGDLLSTLCYLKGSNPSSVCPTNFQALNSPGLFSIPNPASTQPLMASVGSYPAYLDSQNQLAPILLVTHQALTNSERDALKNLVREGHFDRRPITVVYIQTEADPTNSATHHNIHNYLPSVINDFKQAFDIPDPQFDPNSAIGDHNRDNALIVLSPYLESYGCNQSTPEACFSEYWYHLLQDNNENNIEVVARNLFFKRILNTRLKF